MVAHVSFPAIDSRPASLSSWWINHYLRGELEFKGAVISDDLSMVGAAVVGSAATRVQLALEAGCDLVLLCNAPEQVPAVLDSLQGYVNPTAQLRLTRLHGRGELDWESLHASAEWQKASALVAPLRARPEARARGLSMRRCAAARAETCAATARRLYSARDVARALDRMAKELTPRLEHANPVVLAVMHGGAFAALELCKRFRVPARVRLRARHALSRRDPRRRSHVARAAEQGARRPHGSRRRRHPRSRQDAARARRRARAHRRRGAA